MRKPLFVLSLLLINISTPYAEIIFGLNGSYSKIKDKRTDSYGFTPIGAGYGVELGAKAGPFALIGSYSKSTLSDNIVHDSTAGEFSLNSTNFSAIIDTYITSRAFFGVGYGTWSRKVSLSGNLSSTSQTGAFSRYYLSEKVSDNGLLLRAGYSFWKSKSFALSGIYQKNLYSDNQNEDQFLINLRLFIRTPKFGYAR